MRAVARSDRTRTGNGIVSEFDWARAMAKEPVSAPACCVVTLLGRLEVRLSKKQWAQPEVDWFQPQGTEDQMNQLEDDVEHSRDRAVSAEKPTIRRRD